MYRILFILSLSLINTAYAGEMPQQAHIVVNGSHSIFIQPDLLQTSISISEVQQDLATASQVVESRARQLIKKIMAIGIKQEDIQSADLRINPQYRWQNKEQIFIGIEVKRNIVLTLRNLESYDKFIQAILDARVGRINHTQLLSSQQEELTKQALKGAVQDAISKAQLIAASISRPLGDIYSINVLSSQAIRPPTRMLVQESMNSTAFEPGLIEVSEHIKAVFLLDTRH